MSEYERQADELRAKLEASERAAAAMREALELCAGELAIHWPDILQGLDTKVREALSSDAGRDWVRRSDMDAECRRVYESKARDEDEAVAKLDQLRAERDALLAERKAWRAFEIAAGERKSVSEVLSSRLVAVEAERDELKDAVADLGQSVLSLELERDELKAKLDYQRVTLDDQEDTNGMLGRMLSDREDELSAARAALHDARSECAATRNVLQRVDRDYQSFIDPGLKVVIYNMTHQKVLEGIAASHIGREYQAKVQRLVEAARTALKELARHNAAKAPGNVSANQVVLEDALREWE